MYIFNLEISSLSSIQTQTKTLTLTEKYKQKSM